MCNEEKIEKIEESFGYHQKQDWKSTIEFTRELIKECPNDAKVNIRVIYLLHQILVEEEYTKSESEEMVDLLKTYFNSSYQKFLENKDYLFFIGKILFIAEWYFGRDDDSKPMEERLAFRMQKKAYEKEPNNLLFEWAYRLSKNERHKVFTLSKDILYGSNGTWLNYLNEWGFPGKYMVESLESCYRNFNT